MVGSRLLSTFLSALFAFMFCVPIAYADSSVRAVDLVVAASTTQSTALPITGYSVKQVSCGGTSFVGAAVTTDGSLWVWGSENTPTKFMSDVAQVEVMPNHLMSGFAAVKTDGSLWYYDELETDYQTPTKIMDDVKQVSTSFCGLAAVKTDGTLWVWGSNFPEYDSNRDGALGAGSDEMITAPTKIMSDVSIVRLASGFGGAIKNDGSLWMWGDNAYGCVGNGSTESVLSPVKVLDEVVDLQVGGFNAPSSIALKRDGSVWAWGRGSAAGYGSTSPTQVMTGASEIAIPDSGGYGVAVKASGELWMWGDDMYGAIFQDSEDGFHSARKVLDGVKAVAPAARHIAVVKHDSTLWAWGLNQTGNIGVDATGYLAPTKVIEDVSGVATGMTQVGTNYTFALGASGALWSWGQGPTGSGSWDMSTRPLKIFGGETNAVTDKNDAVTNTSGVVAKTVDLTAKATLTLSKKRYVYNGKAKTPGVAVKIGSSSLRVGTDYTVAYRKNTNAGTAVVTVAGKGSYTGALTKTFVIAKSSNSMKVVGKTASVKYSKKKAVKVKASQAYKFKKRGKGSTTFARVAKGSSKWLSVDKKTGTITVKAKAPRKVHAVKVKVAAGNANYKTVSKTITVKVRVK